MDSLIENISYFFKIGQWLIQPIFKIWVFWRVALQRGISVVFGVSFMPSLNQLSLKKKIPLAQIMTPSSCYLQVSITASDILKSRQSGGNLKWFPFRPMVCPCWQLKAVFRYLNQFSLSFVCRFWWLLGLCEIQWGQPAIYWRSQPRHLNQDQFFCQDRLQGSQPVWEQPMLGRLDVCQPVVHLPVCPAWRLCL